MKKSIGFIWMAVTVSTSLFAQTADPSPFAQLGYKKQIMYTSSKGEFDEFHDRTDVVEIGSVLFNTKTNQVVGFVSEEKTSVNVASATTAMSIDPLCEKYYWITPYAYCLNNPVRFIDPDGRDVWEIDSEGKIIQRIEDKTQDTFYMVAQDADGNYQRTYTTDSDGNKTYNSISFEYGTVTSVQEKTIKTDIGDVNATMFNIKGDDKATRLFKFMANPNITTNVEWSHAKIGTAQSNSNIVGTSHEQSSTAVGAYINATGYTIREINHNHPSGSFTLSNGDIENRALYLNHNPNVKMNIYVAGRGYRPYTTFMEMVQFYPPTIKR